MAGPVDLRLLALGLAAWLGALTVGRVPGWSLLSAVALCVLGLVLAARRRPRPRLLGTAVAVVLVASAVAGTGWVREAQVSTGPVARLAAQRATATLEAWVVSDPRVVSGPFGDRVVVRLRVLEVTGTRA